jgi:hemerythrin
MQSRSCMLTTGQEQSSDLHAFMDASHRVLDQMLTELLAAVEADDRDGIRTLWGPLESELLTHMEAEERFILPRFATVDFEEATELLNDHGRIRAQLLEIGVAIDLHYIRARTCRALVERLRAHAQREDDLMYRWVVKNLDPRLTDSVRHHIHGGPA